MQVVLLARERKMPVVAIGVAVQTTRFTYVTGTDSGNETVKDFKGKAVAT
ncbi:MAG: ABC transporter substrate-binding protein [Pseudomonadota bacterium]